jgi:hypothetical protein
MRRAAARQAAVPSVRLGSLRFGGSIRENDKSNGMERDHETAELAAAVKGLSEDLHELTEVNRAHLEHIQGAQRRVRWILAFVILAIIATFAIDLAPVALILKYVH